MGYLEIFGTAFSVIVVVGFFGGLIYVFLFKSHHSNYPLAIRGIGIAMLAGAIKVIMLVLADNVSDIVKADSVDAALGAMAVVGLLMMMTGFGKGPK